MRKDIFRSDTFQWLIPVLLALGVAAALWFYWAQTSRRGDDGPQVQEQAPVPEALDEAPAAGPEHPLKPAPAPAEEPELRPLPPLEESDEYFKLELGELFGEGLEEQLADRRLIERIVATVDNLPREQIADRIKPLTGISGRFAVNEGDTEDRYVLDPANYERYDGLVTMVANADPAEIEQLYRRFYPLFQSAYVDLGYPQDYFNDRVIEVIDHLLATPEPEAPIALVRPHVLYEYADPELEELSPGQKVLLRMGNENAATIKQKLREFRGRISSTGESTQ